MIVIGGSYQEICREPRSHEMYGSGLRAATALAEACKDLTFFSAISRDQQDFASAMIKGLKIESELAERDKGVTFYYYTPVSTPVIDGINAKAEKIEAKGNAVLLFGMIETTAEVEADTIVFDPQQPQGPEPINRAKLKAKRFAVVANASETRALGSSNDLADAARKILLDSDSEVVVIKRGAFGPLVVTQKGVEIVGVYPTERVWPIGSGDIFSAVFAWAWANERYDAFEAVSLASRSTAYYCSEKHLPIPLSTIASEDISDPIICDERFHTKVYVAGPFFNLAEKWLVNLVRDCLISLGAEVFSPFHDVGLGGNEVARKDIEGLKTCNSMLAILDGNDPGTIFEVGYAAACGIPVVGYSRDHQSDYYKMIRGLDIPVMDDLSTCIYNSIWAGIRP